MNCFQCLEAKFLFQLIINRIGKVKIYRADDELHIKAPVKDCASYFHAVFDFFWAGYGDSGALVGSNLASVLLLLIQ